MWQKGARFDESRAWNTQRTQLPVLSASNARIDILSLWLLISYSFASDSKWQSVCFLRTFPKTTMHNSCSVVIFVNWKFGLVSVYTVSRCTSTLKQKQTCTRFLQISFTVGFFFYSVCFRKACSYVWQAATCLFFNRCSCLSQWFGQNP